MAAKRYFFYGREIAHLKTVRRDAAQKGRFRIANLRGDAAHFSLIGKLILKQCNTGRIPAERHIRKSINGIKFHNALLGYNANFCI